MRFCGVCVSMYVILYSCACAYSTTAEGLLYDVERELLAMAESVVIML